LSSESAQAKRIGYQQLTPEKVINAPKRKKGSKNRSKRKKVAQRKKEPKKTGEKKTMR